MAKPTLGVFLGDLQAGGTTALAERGFELVKGQPLSLSRDQRWLASCFKAALKRTKEEAKGHNVVLFLGGDLIEGVNHHGSTQTIGVRRTQREMAVELLRPWAAMAGEVWAVLGTEDHVSSEGEDDESVARAFTGADRVGYTWRLRAGGRVLDWAHHGIRVSQRPSLELAAMSRKAEDIYWQSVRAGEDPPDLIVRHHAHRSPEPIVWRGTTVAVCGCWQMSTAYGHKIAAGVEPSIGFLLWWPATNRLERIVYGRPKEIGAVGRGGASGNS